MLHLPGLNTKIHADTADLVILKDVAKLPYIAGFTTNPSLVKKAGISDYRRFARDLLAIVPDRPVSFEVLSDDFSEMEYQARTIASWGENVFVKIPVMNTKGSFSGELIERLSCDGIKVNVTAVLTIDQVIQVRECLSVDTPSIVSVFAGRIADTGRDPMPIIRDAVSLLRPLPNTELLWASPRELYNLFQANQVGCHIITLLPAYLAKINELGRDLHDFSRETVEMFYRDGQAAGLSFEEEPAVCPLLLS